LREALDRLDLLGLDAGDRGDLRGRWLATKPRHHRARRAPDLVELPAHVDRDPDRARLIRERTRDRLADPPGGVGRELESPAVVELLRRADEADRALLDQVEERQPLVAVVLRDRDDEAEVRLDHPRLRAHVPALDLLGELDLLRSGEQRVLAGLAQEELQRVGRRLDRGRHRGRGRRLLLDLLDELDPAPVELDEDGVNLQRIELERLQDLLELGLPELAARLSGLEQREQLLAPKNDLDLDRHVPPDRCMADRSARPGYQTMRSVPKSSAS